MSEHGFFVWGAYLISALVLLGLCVVLAAGFRQQRRILADLEARKTPRRPSAKAGASASKSKRRK